MIKKITTLIALTFLLFTISANAYQNQCLQERKKFWGSINKINTSIDIKENKQTTDNFLILLATSATVKDDWYGMPMQGFRIGGIVDSLEKVRRKCRYAPENIVYAYEQTKIRVENYLRSIPTRDRNNLLNNETLSTQSPECQKFLIEVLVPNKNLNNSQIGIEKLTKEECHSINKYIFSIEKVMQLCKLPLGLRETLSKSLLDIRGGLRTNPCPKEKWIDEKDKTYNNTVSNGKNVTVKGILYYATLDSAISYKDGSGGVGFMTDSRVGDKIFSACDVDDYCEITGIVNANDFLISVSKARKIQDSIKKIDEQYGDLGLYETFLLKSNHEQCRYTLLHGDKLIETSCLTMTNSKGKKILCTKTKKICKTTKELFVFAKELD